MPTKQKQLEVHGDYTSIANCRTKFSLIFRVMSGILCGQLKISMYLFHSFSRHSGWETTNCALEESSVNNQRLGNAVPESKSLRQTNFNQTDGRTLSRVLGD
jgi:hypothetical protein